MKGAWRRFRTLPPGSRFHDSYLQHQHRRRRPFTRVAFLAGAIVLVAAGVVALVAPGPGLLMIALGAAMVARESESLSRGLDRLQLRLRRRFTPGDARSPR